MDAVSQVQWCVMLRLFCISPSLKACRNCCDSCECISLVSALGIKSFWIFLEMVFLYPWTVALKSFQEENFLVPAGCPIILRPPHGHCMQWAEEGKKLYKTTDRFVSKKCSVLSFVVKWCFWQSFAFVVYIFTLSSLVNSDEIEDLSLRGEKPYYVLEQLFIFHGWVMWKMPSVKTVMNTLKVQPTC